jgi:TolB-like protein/class 3 adenylate cyclase
LQGLILTKTTDTERRLVAILAADVEGFSRLMGSDEVGTFRGLTERRAVLDALIASHRGRIANTAGDSVLAEFASAVDAVQCAVAAQGALAEANAGASPDRHINFRIGVHVGDVMVKGGDLFGDGVNITARLQTLAAPGGVSVSGAAYDHVRKVLPFKFADLGAQQVKNIEEPVRVYAVSAAKAPMTSDSPKASDERKPITLPDKPSIAVLPFQNMSGDPEQEYFADGMVEDITTALSRFTTLFVIARNSSFTYKGRAVDIKQVGRELGVRYVLEGSVRKAAGRLRITGQLIEASSGAHLWAEKFDGALEDVFELQDAVTERVVGAIETSVNQAEINRSRAKPTGNLDAYDYYLRALQQYTLYTRAGSDAAIENAQKAISLDPDYALAKALLSSTYMSRRIRGWGATGEPAKALAVAREAIAQDSNNPSVLRWAGLTLGFWGGMTAQLPFWRRPPASM